MPTSLSERQGIPPMDGRQRQRKQHALGKHLQTFVGVLNAGDGGPSHMTTFWPLLPFSPTFANFCTCLAISAHFRLLSTLAHFCNVGPFMVAFKQATFAEVWPFFLTFVHFEPLTVVGHFADFWPLFAAFDFCWPLLPTVSHFWGRGGDYYGDR